MPHAPDPCIQILYVPDMLFHFQDPVPIYTDLDFVVVFVDQLPQHFCRQQDHEDTQPAHAGDQKVHLRTAVQQQIHIRSIHGKHHAAKHQTQQKSDQAGKQ